MLRHKRTYAILILLLFAVSFYSPFYDLKIVSATMQETFTPTKDAYLQQDDPNANLGAGNNKVTSWNSHAVRTVLEFDIGILPSNTEITNATLCFWIGNTVGPKVRTWRYQKITNDSWVEMIVTWNLEPSVNASYIEHDIDPVALVWFNVSVTDIVDRHSEGSPDQADLLGFRIFDNPENDDNAQSKIMGSRHSAGIEPILILEFAYVDPTPIEVGLSNPEGCGYSDYLTILNDTGLVMYHTLDYPYRYFSNDTAPDDAINDDAVLFGDDDEWYNRPLSWAWEFDGNSSDDIIDYAVVEHSSDISLNDTLTVEAWFKTDDSATQILVYKGNGTVVNYRLWVESGWVRFNIYDGSDDIYCIQPNNTTQTDDGFWHHALATWDRADNATLYVDGLYVNHTVSTIVDPVVLEEDLFIGSNSTHQILNGTIDEIRLWNRTLSSEEITHSYVHGEAHYENWVFVEDHYYDFEAVYQPASGLDTVMISFYDGGINASYDVIEDTYSLTVGNNSADYPYVNLDNVGSSVSAENLTVIFSMFFFKTTADRLYQDIYLWCNSTLGTESEWELKRPAYFNIYNYGGLVRSRIFNPMAVEKIVMGSAWDWKVGPDEEEVAWVQLNTTYRNFQNVRWLTSQYLNHPEVMLTGKGHGYVEYSLYACTTENHIWTKQMGVRMNITDWELGWGANSIEFTVEWYNKTDLVASSFVYGYFEYSINLNATKYVMDLWVDNENSSTVVAGHVNPVYFDKSNWIGLGKGGLYSSMFEVSMTDYDGSVISAQDVCLWRVTSKIYKDDVDYPHDAYTYWATQDTMFNILNAEPKGIDTPLWIEPKEYTGGGWGFFEPLRQSIINLGYFMANAIVWAALRAFNILVGFLDRIAGYFGYPNLVRGFITWLSSMWPLVVNSLSWIASFFVYIFLFFGAVFGTFIGILAISVGHYVNMWTMAWSLLHGGYGVVFDFWVQFNMTVWVEIFVILYPAWVLGIMERKGMTGVISHFQQVASIFSFIFSMLMVVINLMINVISYVINVVF